MAQSIEQNHIILHLDTFVRSIGINKGAPLALLLGSGASISSGIPSANGCIWIWKRAIFLTKNPGLESQFSEITIPSVQQKVQSWLDSEGTFPPKNSLKEYGFYAEAAYPIQADRTRFFQSIAAGTRPYLGYQYLALLAEHGLIKSVWTTNFDGLVSKAAANAKVVCIEVGLDTTHRLDRLPRSGELLIVALHGDYRYDALKNTAAEVQELDRTLRSKLQEQVKDTSLVVIGYSGRDRSIMDTLTEAYSRAGSGRLYWCSHEDSDIPQQVNELLVGAKKAGRDAYYIPTFGFDDLIELNLPR